jgi:hypothetical protein
LQLTQLAGKDTKDARMVEVERRLDASDKSNEGMLGMIRTLQVTPSTNAMCLVINQCHVLSHHPSIFFAIHSHPANIHTISSPNFSCHVSGGSGSNCLKRISHFTRQ